MMKVFKGLVLAIVLAALGAGLVQAGSEAAAGHYADRKVVYHNDGGPDGPAYVRRLLGNLRNHVEAVGRTHVEIRVVSQGDGVALFQAAATDEDLAGRIDALKAVGIRFLVCANTQRERRNDRGTLHGVTEDDVVPSWRGFRAWASPASTLDPAPRVVAPIHRRKASSGRLATVDGRRSYAGARIPARRATFALAITLEYAN